MKMKMKQKHTYLIGNLLVVFLLGVALVQAEDYYFSRCDSGAHSSCIEGDNAAAGTSASAPKRDILGQINFDTVAVGSRFFLACGGKWNLPSQIYIERQTRFVFDWYQHPSGVACVKSQVQGTGEPNGNDTRPQLNVANGSLFYVNFGHQFSHMRLTAQAASGFGIYFFAPTANLRATDIYFSGFHIGFYMVSHTATAHHVGTYAARNVFTRCGMGILGACSHCLIENNLFYRNNFVSGANALSHAIYLSHNGQQNNTVIRCNRFIDNSIDLAQNQCTGGTVTAHGQFSGLLIQRNYLQVTSNYGAAMSCVGISLNPGYNTPEWFYRTAVRDNWIVNIGVGISVTSAPNILIDNNTVVALDSASDVRLGIILPGHGEGINDARDTGATIRNNLVYFNGSAHAYSVGFRTNDGAFSMGTDVQFSNNRVHMVANANGAKCFELKDVPADYARISGLMCTGSAGDNWMMNYPTRTAFNARFSGRPSGAVAGAADPGALTLPGNPNLCNFLS